MSEQFRVCPEPHPSGLSSLKRVVREDILQPGSTIQVTGFLTRPGSLSERSCDMTVGNTYTVIPYEEDEGAESWRENDQDCFFVTGDSGESMQVYYLDDPWITFAVVERIS